MKPLEPDVTLTDFLLTLECAVFVIVLASAGRWSLPLQTAFVTFFAASSLASLFGGLAHGYFPNRHHGKGRLLWTASLVSIGAGTIAIWSIGAQLLFGATVALYITLAAVIGFLGYTTLVITRVPSFSWAVFFYLPSVLFLLAAFTIGFYRSNKLEMFLGIAGTILTLVAAIIQRARIKLLPRYFNHNAFYHLVQAIALLFIFLAARRMIIS